MVVADLQRIQEGKMSISVFWTMLGYMLVCSFTPGPGNILALNATTQFGWQKIGWPCTGFR